MPGSPGGKDKAPDPEPAPPPTVPCDQLPGQHLQPTTTAEEEDHVALAIVRSCLRAEPEAGMMKEGEGSGHRAGRGQQARPGPAGADVPASHSTNATIADLLAGQLHAPSEASTMSSFSRSCSPDDTGPQTQVPAEPMHMAGEGVGVEQPENADSNEEERGAPDPVENLSVEDCMAV